MPKQNEDPMWFSTTFTNSLKVNWLHSYSSKYSSHFSGMNIFSVAQVMKQRHKSERTKKLQAPIWPSAFPSYQMPWHLPSLNEWICMIQHFRLISTLLSLLIIHIFWASSLIILPTLKKDCLIMCCWQNT